MKSKYQFDSSSKKFVCPQCEKRRFVRMVDGLGNYISDEFGRCDRSSSCGYFKYPEKSDLSIKIDFSQPTSTPTKKLGPPSIIDQKIVQQTLKGYDRNPFHQFLSKMFNKEIVDAVFIEYYVGSSKKWGGSTIFWLISKDFHARSGKIMKIDATSGKRIKTPRPLVTWVHSELGLKEFNLKQVLFGEHLLSKYPFKIVCIVESEKTAVEMAIKHPNYLWLATGNKNEFKLEKLNVLLGRKVIVFPDTDAHNEWAQKVEIISKQINLNIRVSPYLINCTIALDQSKGYDLADLKQINIDYANSIMLDVSIENMNLSRLIQRNPYLSKLISLFDLKTFI